MLKQYWWCNNNGYLSLDDLLGAKEGYYSFRSVISGFSYYYNVGSVHLRKYSNGDVKLDGYVIREKSSTYFDYYIEHYFKKECFYEIKKITEVEFNNLKDKI